MSNERKQLTAFVLPATVMSCSVFFLEKASSEFACKMGCLYPLPLLFCLAYK